MLLDEHLYYNRKMRTIQGFANKHHLDEEKQINGSLNFQLVH